MKCKNKRVIVLSGRHEGVEGVVISEDQDSVYIKASGLFGDNGYWGQYYARKNNIKVVCDEPV